MGDLLIVKLQVILIPEQIKSDNRNTTFESRLTLIALIVDCSLLHSLSQRRKEGRKEHRRSRLKRQVLQGHAFYHLITTPGRLSQLTQHLSKSLFHFNFHYGDTLNQGSMASIFQNTN
ncbi:unnamed protein product [Fusarium graminearum]|uniref:Uncharacterized protein n=1 Tax=Gibberella zeae TaxID=5518 RepID=A0A4E9E6N9_GIBZA|nr:unnamed protein product [Fusarium graminearum]CAF3531523.1 unnamed protein product [Fusarium graminearum]CAG1966066.1 unnamed protein product [Fusarium graminearum]CAG2012363.1 unnamed protein product [Fusarium graminearum]